MLKDFLNTIIIEDWRLSYQVQGEKPAIVCAGYTSPAECAQALKTLLNQPSRFGKPLIFAKAIKGCGQGYQEVNLKVTT